MKLLSSEQIEPDKIDFSIFDLIFVASGYEKRARYASQKYKFNNDNAFCICFDNSHVLNRTDNDTFFFKKRNFKQVLLSGECDDEITEILNDKIRALNKQQINILVDYSSMTRVWFSSFLRFFRSCSFGFLKKVSLYYFYSNAQFISPPNETYVNTYIGPIKGFCNITLPDKPSALIIGLGYEKNKAFGLSQYLDAESFIFYTDSSYEPKFSEAIETVNSELLKHVKPQNIFTYPILNMDITSKILNSLIVDILDRYRIVLAPCGPKPFTLLCLLEAIKNEEVDVWRISGGKNAEEIDRVPDGNIMVLNVTFEN